MSYCTPADVRQVLSPDGQQDDYETAAGFSDDALTDAVTRADAMLNARLGSHYAVPVDTATYDTGGLLRDWASVVAAYYATLTYSRGQDIAPDDPIRLRYLEVTKLLDALDKGVTILPFPGTTGENGVVTVVNRYQGQMFDLRDFDIGPADRPWQWGTLPGWGR